MKYVVANRIKRHAPIGGLLAVINVLAFGGWAGCNDDRFSNPSPSGAPVEECTEDDDGDGFGIGCLLGNDCDDDDPESTDECYACTGTPSPGCSCSTEGERADCGRVYSQVGDQVTCGFGQTVCTAGVWGECILNNSLKPQALGNASACVNNPCDPYCKQFSDSPEPSLANDAGVLASDAGLTIGSDSSTSWPQAIDGPPGAEITATLNDAGAMPSGPYYYHELTPGQESAPEPFALTAFTKFIDIYFLLDTSATMGEALVELGNAMGGPTGVIQQIKSVYPNARFGVGHFHGYQQAPHDTNPSGGLVSPLWHTLDMQTSDVAAQNVMVWLGSNGTTANNNATEGFAVGLFAAASADGLSMGGGQYWVNPRNATGALQWVSDYGGSSPPAIGSGPCPNPAVPGGTDPGIGFPCFAPGAKPITIVMTDNPAENGPGGQYALAHPSTEATLTPTGGIQGSTPWQLATNVDATGNGIESKAVAIDPSTFQRYRGSFPLNGAPAGGRLRANGDSTDGVTYTVKGFDASTTHFPTRSQGNCAATDGTGGKEAFFKFTLPSPQFLHFDTWGSQGDMVLYIIDNATRQRVACNDDIDWISASSLNVVDPLMRYQSDIQARLAAGSYTLVVDSKAGYNACPTGYTLLNGDAYFTETFDDNSQGWTLGTDWEIKPATASSGHSYAGPDPSLDHTPTGTNGVAGVKVGGNAPISVHDFHYLTSPVIDLAKPVPVTLEYLRFLNSDYAPFMVNVVEVYDGSAWVRIYESGGSPGVQDTVWTKMTHDVTAYKNANFRVRFGFNMASGVFNVASWNIDDVRLSIPTCYRYSGSTTANANVSRDTCNAEGAKLASIESALEDSVLTAAFPGMTSSATNIGLRQNTAGTFTWLDSTPYAYDNWAAGSPTAAVCTRRTTAGTWESIACSGGGAPVASYVCEKKLTVAGADSYFLQVNAKPDNAPIAVPSWDQMIAAHNAIGGKIIGIDVSGMGPIDATGTAFDTCTDASGAFSNYELDHAVDRWGFLQLQEAARATGSINGLDSNPWTNPFVFAMDKKGQPCHDATDPPIGSQVVNAVSSLTQNIREDITVAAIDEDDLADFDYAGPPGAVPQLTPYDFDEGPQTGRPYGYFINSVTAVPGFTNGVNGSGDPAPGGLGLRCNDNAATTDVIEQCLPDTAVQFTITFSVPSTFPQQAEAQIFKFSVAALASGATIVGSKPAIIVVPPYPQPIYNDATWVRDYDTSTVCPQGTAAVWGHWSWTTSTPGDSRVNFRIATAKTAAGLATAPIDNVQFTNPPGPAALVGTSVGAKAGPPDTQTGAAVIDTSLALNDRQRRWPHLRVYADLKASTNGLEKPLLQGWNLEVSCPPAE